jgi:hypothetical protein
MTNLKRKKRLREARRNVRSPLLLPVSGTKIHCCLRAAIKAKPALNVDVFDDPVLMDSYGDDPDDYDFM